MSGMRPEDVAYLRHVLDAIARIESYVAGVDRARFESTHLIQDAVVRQVQVIGQATKRLSDDLLAASRTCASRYAIRTGAQFCECAGILKPLMAP